MSKFQSPIGFRPDYTGAASVRAFGLAIEIARARKRHGRESKHEPELRRSEALLRRMRMQKPPNSQE
jgi:hypothetical protein